jgi:RNA polymerase sigma-70 factor (ECF subfamily)
MALLHRAQAGDDGARERLYRRLLPVMRRWARGQVPERARAHLDSDDLVQEVLTETLVTVQTLEPRRDHGLHVYLREALRNKIRDELRRIYRNPGQVEELSEALPADDPSPFDNAVNDEAHALYEAALEELPEAERVMIVARVEFGLSWRDIAELGEKPSEDAARMTVSRALVRIARSMGGRVP